MRYNDKVLYNSSGKPILKIYHSTTNPGKRQFITHHHTECELSLITSGEGLYTVKNKTYRFSKGDVFLFNSNEIHCITNIYDTQPFDVLNIHFEPKLLWSDEGFGSTALLKIFFNRSETFENRIDPGNVHTHDIAQKIAEIEHELITQDFEYSLAVKSKLCDILLSLSRYYGYINTSGLREQSESNSEKMVELLNYIDNNLSENIKLDDLAEIVGINKTYFCSVFKKYNGISPFEYITIKRIEKAIHLLKNTQRTKLDIATECGFNTMSNFYKAFYSVTGKKPGDLQKK